jgi:hypothetical protein
MSCINMKNIALLSLCLLILLAMAGTVSGEVASSNDTGLMTNVHFCKMIKVGEKYEFQPLLTLYTGVNDWGRLTFIAGMEKLEKGDYALVQETPGGLELIQSLKIEPSGSATPDYVMLNLEIRKDQLAVPLKILEEPGTSETPAPIATTATAPVTTAITAATAVPTATKTPVNPLSILAAIGIAGIVCLLRR